MKRATQCLATFALATLVTACASDQAAYPSLARRDIERMGSTPAPPPPAEPPAATDPSLAPRLASLVEQARVAHERFGTRRARAEQLTTSARGSAMASEGWSVASVALADLESARSDAMIALADLDQLFAAARIAGGDAAAISAAREQVMGWIGEEDEVLSTLRGRLGG